VEWDTDFADTNIRDLSEYAAKRFTRMEDIGFSLIAPGGTHPTEFLPRNLTEKLTFNDLGFTDRSTIRLSGTPVQGVLARSFLILADFFVPLFGYFLALVYENRKDFPLY
jgi:hypothetical protein